MISLSSSCLIHIFLICKTEIHRLIIESYDLIFVRGFKLLRHFDYYLRDLHATRDTAHPPRRIDLPSRKSLRNREKSTSPDIGQAFFIYTRIKIKRGLIKQDPPNNLGNLFQG